MDYKEEEGRERKEGGGRGERKGRGGKGGAARETKVLSVACALTDTQAQEKHAHSGKGACSRKRVFFVTHFSHVPCMCFCMMTMHTIM